MLKKNRMKIMVFLLLFFVSFIYINAAEELPDDAGIITSTQIVQTQTGTAPFDDNDEAGNDSSADNNIVRSFDTVTWTIENTFGINGTSASSYNGGKLYFEATLPTDIFSFGTARWDLNSMSWIEDANLSADKLTLTGYYSLNSNEVTVPGKQTLIFVANIFGAKNGTEFQPTINLWLNGNYEDEYSTFIPEKVSVSSTPKYNVALVRNSQKRLGSVVDTNQEISGIIYGYNLTVQLYNDSEEKGLKGVEYPKGDITFDLNLNLERYNADSSGANTGSAEDITGLALPLLYNYSVDGETKNGYYKDRTLYFVNAITPHSNRYNNNISPTQAIYKTGNITCSQELNVIHVTIRDYAFDGLFPSLSAFGSAGGAFKANIGCFSNVLFQIIIPSNDETQKENTNVYLNVNNSNVSITSSSDEKITTQAVTTDDSTKVQYKPITKGNYWVDNYIMKKDFNGNFVAGFLHSLWNTGDAYATKENVVWLCTSPYQPPSNLPDEHAIYGINNLIKFDTDCYEPLESYNGRQIFKSSGDFEFQIFYATKEDGTGWSSQDELKNARIEDLKYYSTLQEIKDANITCVGVLLESTSGQFKTSDGATWNEESIMAIPVKVKDSSNIGQTYIFCSDCRLYDTVLDRTVESMGIQNGIYNTTPLYTSNYGSSYIKTEYDANGIQISGTHVDVHSGNSILVVGADQDITITSIDSTGATKTEYDLSKNVNKAKFKVIPTITNTTSSETIEDITVKITTTLPSGLTYVPNSCNYGEPEVTNNSDGTIVLVWQVTDCIVNQEITPLIFESYIDENTANQTQYTVNTVMLSDKISNMRETVRTASSTITITNLASHRFYKVTDEVVIERNGQIHYTVSYKNRTTDAVPNFQLLDVLPYNGDDRGSNFNGTYKVDRIAVTQQDSTGATISNDNLQILYTNDETARNATCKDSNLGNDWNEITVENINQNATAIAIKGEVGAQSSVTLEIYLITENNKELDMYINNAMAQIDAATDALSTTNITTQVVTRRIEGTVWYDSNNDGIMDEEETKASNIEVSITDGQGQQVTDVNGNILGSILTDVNGYYEFTSLPIGTYYVRVVMPNSTYCLTEKNVGTNSEINSKYNVESNETDEITELNSLDLPVLTASNVNAGLVKKEAQVNVYHVEKGIDTSDLSTIETLYPTETIEGRVDDEYITESRESQINENNEYVYRLSKVTDNTTGIMTETEINVIYEYSVVGKITITKTDRNDSTKFIEGVTFKIERIDDENNVSSTFTTMESTTDSKGIAEFNEVPIGRYRVTEIKAAEGYELLEDVIIVELTKENKELNITASDRLKLELPKTGGINYTIIISAVGLTVIVLSIMLYLNKKEEQID